MFLTATNWSDVWSMTGIGIGIVFVILLLLVLVLQIFTLLAVKKAPKSAAAPAAKAHVAAENPNAPLHEDEEETAAAIAAALYLFSEEAHDNESGVITIVHNDHSTWHHFN